MITNLKIEKERLMKTKDKQSIMQIPAALDTH